MEKRVNALSVLNESRLQPAVCWTADNSDVTASPMYSLVLTVGNPDVKYEISTAKLICNNIQYLTLALGFVCRYLIIRVRLCEKVKASACVSVLVV